MRIFYENLATSIENVYDAQTTVENVLFLEDIVKNPKKDLYIQYKNKTNESIPYTLSNIVINGVIKCKNHLYFINYYKSTYNDYAELLNTSDNKILIKVENSNISSGDPYKISIQLNSTKIEELEYTDTYTLYNRKQVQLDSVKLGTTIVLTQPLHLNSGDYTEYTIRTIYVTTELAMHRYLASFDKVNNSLIFDQQYKNNEIYVLAQSIGTILRANTINELYKVNANSFVQFDENSNSLTIPTEQVFKSGGSLKYILNQTIIINPAILNIGYNLLGIYLDDVDILTYDPILYDSSYSGLLSKINNYQLDTLRKSRNYYGFIIGLNNITSFLPTDLFLYNVGAGGGGGSGSVNKIVVDCTNTTELEINYVAGTQVPVITIFNYNGDQVVPENIHYNMNDTITITFGESFTGQVGII